MTPRPLPSSPLRRSRPTRSRSSWRRRLSQAEAVAVELAEEAVVADAVAEELLEEAVIEEAVAEELAEEAVAAASDEEPTT